MKGLALWTRSRISRAWAWVRTNHVPVIFFSVVVPLALFVSILAIPNSEIRSQHPLNILMVRVILTFLFTLLISVGLLLVGGGVEPAISGTVRWVKKNVARLYSTRARTRHATAQEVKARQKELDREESKRFALETRQKLDDEFLRVAENLAQLHGRNVFEATLVAHEFLAELRNGEAAK